MLRSVGIARAVMAGGLIVTCALRIEWMMQSSTPWIILLFLIVAPLVADSMVSARPLNSGDGDVLPQLSKRYRYSTRLLRARLVTYVMTVALMLYWQYLLQQQGSGIRYMMPVICVIVSVITLVTVAIIYAVDIRRSLEHGEI